MMDMENVKQYLSNIYENYLVDTKDYAPLAYRAKCLGAMEGLLVVLGILKPGVPFNYQTMKSTFNLFWLIPITFSSKESYPQLILRLTRETLNHGH